MIVGVTRPEASQHSPGGDAMEYVYCLLVYCALVLPSPPPPGWLVPPPWLAGQDSQARLLPCPPHSYAAKLGYLV